MIGRVFRSLGREGAGTELIAGSRWWGIGWGGGRVIAEMFGEFGVVPGDLLDLVQLLEFTNGEFA